MTAMCTMLHVATRSWQQSRPADLHSSNVDTAVTQVNAAEAGVHLQSQREGLHGRSRRAILQLPEIQAFDKRSSLNANTFSAKAGGLDQTN